MTNLIEFRRQRQIKKRTEELAEQLEKQNTALSHLQTLFTTHEHENYAAKAHVHEKYVAKTELPKPYVHPKTGVCPQKPQPHGHIAKDIADLKIPEPYDLEQLKKDHPKLTEPHLHEPKKHSHDAEDIRGKIKPEQIEKRGLDADMVDGKHAKDLIKRVVYMGGGEGSSGPGGPHGRSHETGGEDKVYFSALEHTEADVTTHDNLTATPHISQTDKDKIHERQHALDSPDDHSGVINDSQHGAQTTIPDAHHPRMHAESHRITGADKLGFQHFTFTLPANTSYVDVLFPTAYPSGVTPVVVVTPPYATSFWVTLRTNTDFRFNVGTTNAYAQVINCIAWGW